MVTEGDEKGEYTFTGKRGNTVIDYVIGNIEVKERVVRMKVGDRINSDHHIMELWRGGGGVGRRGGLKRERYWGGV